MSPSAKHLRRSGGERGFGLLQIVIVLGIAGIIASMAIFGIRAARASTRLGNSARAFAQAAEKARLDAIRRRTTTHVEFTDSNTYEITMDFTGNGTSTTRTFTLDTGVVITDSNGTTLTSASDSLPYADFDWRGRTFECNALFNFKNDRNEKIVTQIAGSGDISVNSSVTGLPTITYATVNSTSDVNPSATLTGTDTKCNLSPCGATTSSTTCETTSASSPPPQQCTAGTLTPSTTYISDLKRNGGNTRTVTISVTGPGTISLTPDSTGNVSVISPASPTTQTISSSSGGAVTYTLKSVTRSQGTFTLKFSYSNCNTSVNVRVTK